MVHGYAEHSGRYHHLAQYFNNQGYNVYAYDRFGHGRSPGKRGHSRSFDLMLEEISILIDQAQNDFPEAPTILYGHSQGGNLALNYMLRKSPQINGVIATGPWIYLGNPPPKYQENILRWLSKIFPALAVPTNLDPKLISNDPVEVEKYIEDPLVFSTITLATGAIMMDAADFLKLQHQSETPILIMHGTEDNICLPKGTEEFNKNFEGNLKVEFWKGGFHEIHNDVGKLAVYQYAHNWIKSVI